MRNFQDTLETRKRSFIRAFSICMTIFKFEQILLVFLLLTLKNKCRLGVYRCICIRKFKRKALNKDKKKGTQ